MAQQQHISLELNQEKVGRSFSVIIDREEGDFFIGRTQYDSPEVDNEVLIESEKPLHTGEFYTVEITDAAEFDIYGKIMG